MKPTRNLEWSHFPNYLRLFKFLSGVPLTRLCTSLFQNGFGVEALRVRHKDVFHVRFHPAITQPTKVLIRPTLEPTLQQRLRIACMDPQAAAAQLDSVDVGK